MMIILLSLLLILLFIQMAVNIGISGERDKLRKELYLKEKGIEKDQEIIDSLDHKIEIYKEMVKDERKHRDNLIDRISATENVISKLPQDLKAYINNEVKNGSTI